MITRLLFSDGHIATVPKGETIGDVSKQLGRLGCHVDRNKSHYNIEHECESAEDQLEVMAHRAMMDESARARCRSDRENANVGPRLTTSTVLGVPPFETSTQADDIVERDRLLAWCKSEGIDVSHYDVLRGPRGKYPLAHLFMVGGLQAAGDDAVLTLEVGGAYTDPDYLSVWEEGTALVHYNKEGSARALAVFATDTHAKAFAALIRGDMDEAKRLVEEV